MASVLGCLGSVCGVVGWNDFELILKRLLLEAPRRAMLMLGRMADAYVRYV